MKPCVANHHLELLAEIDPRKVAEVVCGSRDKKVAGTKKFSILSPFSTAPKHKRQNVIG